MSEQKVAIVTGAGSGIGTGMALVLAEHGYDVAISYRTHEGGAKEMQQQIRAMGRKCLIYKADHSTAEGCAPFVNKVRKDFGRLDAIILNAGLDCRNSILTATPEERARRRVNEFEQRGEKADYDEILRQINSRDASDMAREVGPLCEPPDATRVVTDGMTIEQVVAKLVSVVESQL